MPEACNSDLVEYAATIGVNYPDQTFYARCGCGLLVLESGTQDEAVSVLEAHRAESNGG